MALEICHRRFLPAGQRRMIQSVFLCKIFAHGHSELRVMNFRSVFKERPREALKLP